MLDITNESVHCGWRALGVLASADSLTRLLTHAAGDGTSDVSRCQSVGGQRRWPPLANIMTVQCRIVDPHLHGKASSMANRDGIGAAAFIADPCHAARNVDRVLHEVWGHTCMLPFRTLTFSHPVRQIGVSVA